MLVIVGSGLAGYMLAKEWRKLDGDTPLTIVTASKGDFYSKPLLSTALTAKRSAQQLAMTQAAQMAEQLNAKIHTEVQVERIDREERYIVFNNERVHYAKLVLACGSSPIHLPLKGDGAEDVISVNNLEDYAHFRHTLDPEKKRITVLGSGLVGCEFANDLLNVGYDIDIVSLDPYPLARFVPEKIGKQVQHAFAEKGARWHLNQAADAVWQTPTGYRVQLNNGNELMADLVLSAVGLVANHALAQQAGLDVQRGITVNRQLQTSDLHIYALGDCAEVCGHVKQYVAPLLQCARALAKVLAGEEQQVHYPNMPIVIKTPACPLVTLPAPPRVDGQWQYEGEGRNLRALFFDAEKQLRGFTLMGDKLAEKMKLAKQMPEVFSA